MSQTHPLHDDGPDYMVDPVSVANMVSSLLQIVLALIGPEKAKAALDWETKAAIDASAAAANASADAAALAVLTARGVL